MKIRKRGIPVSVSVMCLVSELLLDTSPLVFHPSDSSATCSPCLSVFAKLFLSDFVLKVKQAQLAGSVAQLIWVTRPLNTWFSIAVKLEQKRRTITINEGQKVLDQESCVSQAAAPPATKMFESSWRHRG